MKHATLSATVLRLFADLENLRAWVRANASSDVALAFARDCSSFVPKFPRALLDDTALLDALRPTATTNDPELFLTAVPLEIATHIVRQLIQIGDSMRVDVFRKTDDRALRLVIAEWTAATYFDVLRPLLCQHPQLTPPGFRAAPSHS